ncbi:Mudr family transposase, partial [Thalictrum thalictroides]
YVSSEDELDDMNDEEDAEDTDFVPPISEDDESSDMSTDEEGENVEVVPENVNIEEEADEVKQFKKLAENIFEAEDDEDKEVNPALLSDMKLVPKMKWNTMKECRRFFRNYAVTKRFQWTQVKNDRKRYQLKCADEKCKWYIRCSLKKDNHTVQLRKHYDVHVCETDWQDKCVHINAPWVISKVLDSFRVHPDWKPKNIKAEVKRQWAYDITYWTAWNARVKMLEIINGNYEESFAMVPELRRQILKGNPDSVCR